MSEQNYLKIRLLEDIEHSADFQMMGELLIKWSKKSENTELKEFSMAFNKMFFYIHNLQSWRDNSHKAMSQYRQDKLRAVTRARKSELKIKRLEKELEKLKSIVNL
jgi:hypothetical protein